MNLPSDSLIAFTMEKMQARLAEKSSDDGVSQLRSGLLYLGNVQDAYPRQLLLDTRLSPLDKMAWMMIRLYAQQNYGAVFPSYDEMQLQLASPHKGKASRETVSRVLMMLRLTGWLSLCKRVRDDQGRVRGNIYAQHDEPLTCCDAEIMDPAWLDTVAEACRSGNKTIKQTALQVLDEIKNDPQMRHCKSHISQIENRLCKPQTPQEMAAARKLFSPNSVSEPGIKTPSSGAEPSIAPHSNSLSSVSEPSLIPRLRPGVRNPNGNVRCFTQGVKKNTFTPAAPASEIIPERHRQCFSQEDLAMLEHRLAALPAEQSQQLLHQLGQNLDAGSIQNPTGWLLAIIKKARTGQFTHIADSPSATSPAQPAQPEPTARAASSAADIAKIVQSIRQRLNS
ncbi:Helix-turn-helix domain-containing protein [Candidatus Pantoea symbiotica]|uniref:Helix-turn-helix domain-containing protein n=1 Tax=Candidatus Pantoea symbiotica TaxID=1884370 RepID=A0A1I3VAN6_9GAMM|nr:MULTISPECIES: STY4528 family pathogenicity island replication protein [Pantoea]SFJ92524.1 Helix-turn-helix domain-containing protein [Pantoea symbiotica]SFU64194.1 Helix-turn-helix domain-containing protein [Pantoea sp. YR525]